MTRTYRRKLLDELLEESRGLMSGNVVDLGGKRSSPRGHFRPRESQETRWTFVNLDSSTEPDVCSDIADVPLESASADCVICTETLQHVTSPQAVVDEAARLLRPGGTFIGSIPFLYPVHKDPADYWRIGPDGLRFVLDGFQDVTIFEMGGIPAVFGLFLERIANGFTMWRPLRVPLKAAIRTASTTLFMIDSGNRATAGRERIFTTGYFFTCIKQA